MVSTGHADLRLAVGWYNRGVGTVVAHAVGVELSISKNRPYISTAQPDRAGELLKLASWYQRENWLGKPMRISRYAGRGMKKAQHNWGVVSCLVPDWELVKAYRSGRISEQEYSSAYKRGLEESWGEVLGWLSSLSPDEDITLLCHEPEGQFCHRRLVGELVKQYRPDIPVDLR